MGSRRTVIIIAAVAVAAIAAIANVTYLNNVQNRAYDNARRVWVYRVKGPIGKGSTGDASMRIVRASHGDTGLYLALVPRNNKPNPAPPVIGDGQLYSGTLTPCANDKSCGDR